MLKISRADLDALSIAIQAATSRLTESGGIRVEMGVIDNKSLQWLAVQTLMSATGELVQSADEVSLAGFKTGFTSSSSASVDCEYNRDDIKIIGQPHSS